MLNCNILFRGQYANFFKASSSIVRLVSSALRSSSLEKFLHSSMTVEQPDVQAALVCVHLPLLTCDIMTFLRSSLAAQGDTLRLGFYTRAMSVDLDILSQFLNIFSTVQILESVLHTNSFIISIA